jgi:hypothetical protein
MSLEMHVLIVGPPPETAEWQAAIDRLGLPVQLDPATNVVGIRGFSPCKLLGEKSGFELYVDDVNELVSTYPSLAGVGTKAQSAISFRWGGDLGECACVMAAAAGLVTGFSGVAYYPDDDLFCDLERLRSDFNEALSCR